MKSLFIALCFLIQCTIHAQQIVQTTNDIYKLEANKEQFINKPLKDLLKEIKPEIKTVFVMNGENFFYFKFLPIDQLRREEGSLEDRVSLFIYVKGGIDWKWEKRPKDRETIWTQGDIDNYGNLIVARISIFYPKD